MIAEARLQVFGDVLCRQRRANFACLERGYLRVQSAYNDALFIRQDRAIDCPGNMVFGELCRGAHVDNFVKLVEL